MRILALVLMTATAAFGQKKDTPPIKPPDAATLKLIAEKTAELKKLLKDRENSYATDDIMVCLEAAERIVRLEEWLTNDAGKQTLAVLHEGIRRAKEMGGVSWRHKPTGYVIRGYRSSIDDSIQPYGVVYPKGYDPAKQGRIDVHLHGRDGTLTEVKFLHEHLGKAAPKDQEFVQLNIYGRGNNAYRWSGEKDVLDVLSQFRANEHEDMRDYDSSRTVLKGFSMGGAGTWHLGLRHPTWFAALQPGAGFVTTHGYVGKLPKELPDYIEKCLTIYDAERYALNAFNVPVVAYSGEKDPQKAAADRIETAVKRLGVGDRFTHLVAPTLEHKFPPEWQAKAEAKLREYVGDGKGREWYPPRVRFITHTTLNGTCDWVGVVAMEKLYDPATVDAHFANKRIAVTTANVRELELRPPPRGEIDDSASIDGQAVEVTWVRGDWPPAKRFRRDTEGRWSPAPSPMKAPFEKREQMVGPIDAAFLRPFLCIEGTGTPWNAGVDGLAKAQLERFRREWDKHFRGILPVKRDVDVTEDDLGLHHIILFGDPGSNKLIRDLLPKLPIQWTKEKVMFAGKEYGSADHLPMLIYPSDMKWGKYVVLNSGHTFHDTDFKGSNALLYPRLGDFALVKPTEGSKDPAAFDLVTAGLFDEQWQFPKK